MGMRSKDSWGEMMKAGAIGAGVASHLGHQRRQEKELRRIRKAVESQAQGQAPEQEHGPGLLATFLGMVFWLVALASILALPVFAFFAVRDLLALRLGAVFHDLVACAILGVVVWLGLALQKK